LVVYGVATNWAVDARQVVRIVARTDWRGEPPREMSELVGVVASDEEAARVVVLDAGERLLAVAARGAIGLRAIEPGDVVALPPEILTSVRARAVVGVVFAVCDDGAVMGAHHVVSGDTRPHDALAALLVLDALRLHPPST
jgi:hypothetical protein